MRTTRPSLGRRRWHGVSWGPLVRLERGQSLLVVGPTQAGKTSSLVVPAILAWDGPVVVTSVKGDVVSSTQDWRRGLGRVTSLEPGAVEGLTWDPLEGIESLRRALRVAQSLATSSARADADFWNALAVKLVAALFVVARRSGRDVFDVASAVESRAWSRWIDADSDADEMLRSFLDYEPKTLDGVVTTAETMLLPWRFRQPLARLGDVLEGPHTLYLCSPRGEHASYQPLFRGALRSVLEEQQRRHESGDATEVLMVLDEAATVAGMGVTLVTVVQDFSQLVARWGPRAATIVNNHAARLLVAGLSDPAVERFVPEAAPAKDDPRGVPLRQRPRGTATVVAGSRPVFEVRLVPWWRQRRLRARGVRQR